MSWDSTGKTAEEIIIQRRKDFFWGWIVGLFFSAATITAAIWIHPAILIILGPFGAIMTFLMWKQKMNWLEKLR